MVRTALIGYGLAARWFHRPLLTAAGAEVVMVVTRSPERRAEAAADLPAVRLLDAPDDVWERASDIDLVVVATPPQTHAPLALEAVAAGVPCVVEKPFALNAHEARAVAGAAAAAHVPVIPFHNRRWDVDTLSLRHLLDNGALGTVWRHESRFERWRPQPRPGAWREELSSARGGGLLLDLGTHLVDQALTLYGPARLVYADVEARRDGADDDVHVVLQHDAGVTSDLWASAVAAAPGPRLRVLGSRVGVVIPTVDPQEDQLRSGMLPTDGGFGIDTTSVVELRQGDVVTPMQPQPGAWLRFYEGVMATVTSGAPPPVTLADAIAVMEILDAAR